MNETLQRAQAAIQRTTLREARELEAQALALAAEAELLERIENGDWRAIFEMEPEPEPPKPEPPEPKQDDGMQALRNEVITLRDEVRRLRGKRPRGGPNTVPLIIRKVI